MYEQVEKPKESKSSAVANSVAQKKNAEKQGFGFVDNRAEHVNQRKLQKVINNYSPQEIQSKKKNKSGLCMPQNLPVEPCESIVQRLEMELNESFPSVNEPQSGMSVLSDTGKSSIKMKQDGLDEDEPKEELELYVGQDYLSKEVSEVYKNDSGSIKGEKVKIWTKITDESDDKTHKGNAGIIDGHHRAVWLLYHGHKLQYNSTGDSGTTGKFGDLKYQDDPKNKVQTSVSEMPKSE
jgi:hypothetical protein